MFLNKHKKFRKGRLSGNTTNNLFWRPRSLFIYGIRVQETGYISLAQLEAARKAIQKILKRHRRLKTLHLRISATISRSKKKKGLRMGGSKGGFYNFTYRARPGVLLFEIRSILSYQLRRRLNYILAKLPVQANLVILRKNSFKDFRVLNL